MFGLFHNKICRRAFSDHGQMFAVHRRHRLRVALYSDGTYSEPQTAEDILNPKRGSGPNRVHYVPETAAQILNPKRGSGPNRTHHVPETADEQLRSAGEELGTHKGEFIKGTLEGSLKTYFLRENLVFHQKTWVFTET